MTGGGLRPAFWPPLSGEPGLEEGVLKLARNHRFCATSPRSVAAMRRKILRLARSESFGAISRAAEIGGAGAQQ